MNRLSLEELDRVSNDAATFLYCIGTRVEINQGVLFSTRFLHNPKYCTFFGEAYLYCQKLKYIDNRCIIL
jgi:hypothetical protein